MINFINEIYHENPKDFRFSMRNRSEDNLINSLLIKFMDNLSKKKYIILNNIFLFQ